MKLSDFTLLSDYEKKGTLLHRGVLLAKREAVGCKVFLFDMNDYYVEMFCNMRSKRWQNTVSPTTPSSWLPTCKPFHWMN
jgi:hypothetical protein